MMNAEQFLYENKFSSDLRTKYDERQYMILQCVKDSEEKVSGDPEQRAKGRQAFYDLQIENIRKKDIVIQKGINNYLEFIRDRKNPGGLLADARTVIASNSLQDILNEQKITESILFDNTIKTELVGTPEEKQEQYLTCYYFLIHKINVFYSVAMQLKDDSIMSLEAFNKEVMKAIIEQIKSYGIYPGDDLKEAIIRAYKKGKATAVSEELELFGI